MAGFAGHAASDGSKVRSRVALQAEAQLERLRQQHRRHASAVAVAHCAAAGLAPRFWNCDTEPEGLVEAVQIHAPFVMRGRARRDDAFGSAMRALVSRASSAREPRKRPLRSARS